VPLIIDKVDLSITNFFIFCLVVFFSIYLVINNGLVNAKLVSYPMQSIIELLFNFIVDLLKTNFNTKDVNKYLAFVTTIFLFILFSNLVGMIPYSFTLTSHIIVTLAFS